MAAAARKHKARKIGGKIKSFLFTVFVLAASAAVILFFTHKYFFKIENIVISENEKYSYDEISEILKTSGIKTGNALFEFSAGKAEKNIKEILTYADSVRITRKLPSTVSVDIKTERGFFGIMLGGDYYIISNNFRVTEKIKVVGSGISESDFKPPEGIITFETDAVKKCYIGEQMEFSDEDVFGFLKEIAGLLKDEENYEMISMISGINITNKYKVVMNYGDKFLVRYGIFENITPKMFNSFKIIGELPDYAEGIIDMTEVKPASFKYDENVSELYNAGKDKRG